MKVRMKSARTNATASASAYSRNVDFGLAPRLRGDRLLPLSRRPAATPRDLRHSRSPYPINRCAPGWYPVATHFARDARHPSPRSIDGGARVGARDDVRGAGHARITNGVRAIGHGRINVSVRARRPGSLSYKKRPRARRSVLPPRV